MRHRVACLAGARDSIGPNRFVHSKLITGSPLKFSTPITTIHHWHYLRSKSRVKIKTGKSNILRGDCEWLIVYLISGS